MRAWGDVFQFLPANGIGHAGSSVEDFFRRIVSNFSPRSRQASVIDFLIVAFAIFMGVKAINKLKCEEAVAPTVPPVPSPQETLLTEIRDLIKEQNSKPAVPRLGSPD